MTSFIPKLIPLIIGIRNEVQKQISNANIFYHGTFGDDLLFITVYLFTLHHVVILIQTYIFSGCMFFFTSSAFIQGLHTHVENGLGRNLQTRCSATLTQTVNAIQIEMTGKCICAACCSTSMMMLACLTLQRPN